MCDMVHLTVMDVQIFKYSNAKFLNVNNTIYVLSSTCKNNSIQVINKYKYTSAAHTFTEKFNIYLLVLRVLVIKWATVYREFFASGNFGENDAWMLC